MHMTILGGCGAWPVPGQACSGYLVEHRGFSVLIDPGYGTLPQLLRHVPAGQVDAVLISHGHPDHCADLNPLLRARALDGTSTSVLPVHALPRALDAVLALDEPHVLAEAYTLVEFTAGKRFEMGPFTVDTWALPHFVPNAGMRISAGDHVLAYTGDTGPSTDIVTMARDADVLLAEATFSEYALSAQDARYLSTACQAGEHASHADAGRLVLTHLWPGSDPCAAREAARRAYAGPLDIAMPGLVIPLA